MDMKKFSIGTFVILICSVLLTSYATAVLPVVRYTAINDTVNQSNNVATYAFSLSNIDSKDDKYQFYTIGGTWDIYPTLFSVPAGGTINFNLDITLKDEELIGGVQIVPITIKSVNTGNFIVEYLNVNIKSSNGAPTYAPNVAVTVNMKDVVDPREPVSIEINMRNRNPLDITDLRITTDSPMFSKEVQTTLGPLEEKTNQILLNLNKLQEPGTYIVYIKLVAQNKTVAQVQKEVRVIRYSNVSIEETKVNRLFSHTDYIKLFNDGNDNTIQPVKIEKNYFERMFTTSSVKYTKMKEDGTNYIAWIVPLGPQAEYDITVTTNYSIIFIVILIILAIIILYYIFRSPVLLYKRAKIIASSDDGITEIRVKLHVKNRSGREIRSVKVIDRYPKIVSLVEEDTIGSLKPIKMLSADKIHSLLMWNLEALEPYEERLLSYTVRSRLNIVGNMHLHSAKVKFKAASGERTTSSNDVMLMHRSVNLIKYE